MSNIKVKPVDGRAIAHPVTGNRIVREMTVDSTPAIRRAIEVGDLEVVEQKKSKAEVKAETEGAAKNG